MVTARAPQSAAVVHKAARAALGATGAVFPPQARGPALRDALAACGYGLALLEGEHVVAWLDHGGEGGFEGALLTDRMFLARSGGEVSRAPLAEIEGAAAQEGWLQSSVKLSLVGGEEVEVALTRDVAAVARLLGALAEARYAPQARRAPLVTVTGADPGGLGQLAASLQEPTREVQALLRALAERGLGPREAQEAGVRVALLHRALHYGRPTHEGRWLSPLERPRLAAALVACRPGKHRLEQGRARTVFEVNPRESSLIPDREQLQEALLASVADRFTRRALGVELSDLIEEEVETLRITIEDGVACEALVEGSSGQGEEAAPSAWARLRGAAASLLGQAPPRGHVATFSVEGWLGGRFVELSARRPAVVHALSGDLLQHELQPF